MDVVKKKENGDEVEEELFLYREEIDFNNIFAFNFNRSYRQNFLFLHIEL